MAFQQQMLGMPSADIGTSFGGTQGDLASNGYVMCWVAVPVGSCMPSQSQLTSGSIEPPQVDGMAHTHGFHDMSVGVTMPQVDAYRSREIEQYDQQQMLQPQVMMWGGQPQGFQMWDSRVGQQEQQQSQIIGNAPGHWNTSAATFVPPADEGTPQATFHFLADAPNPVNHTPPVQSNKSKKLKNALVNASIFPKSASPYRMLSALGLEAPNQEAPQKSQRVEVDYIEERNVSKGRHPSIVKDVRSEVRSAQPIASSGWGKEPGQLNSQAQNQARRRQNGAGRASQQLQHRQSQQDPNCMEKKHEEVKLWSGADFPSLAAFDPKSKKGMANKGTTLQPVESEMEVTKELPDVQGSRIEGTAWGKSAEEVRKTTAQKRDPQLGNKKEPSRQVAAFHVESEKERTNATSDVKSARIEGASWVKSGGKAGKPAVPKREGTVGTKVSDEGTVGNVVASEKLAEEELHNETTSLDEPNKQIGDEGVALERGVSGRSNVEFTTVSVQVEVAKSHESKQSDDSFLVDIEIHNNKEYVLEADGLADKLVLVADKDGRTNDEAFEEATTDDEEDKSYIDTSEQDMKEDENETSVKEDEFDTENEDSTHEDDQHVILKARDTVSHVDSVAMLLSYRCFSDAVPEAFVYSAVEPSSLCEEQSKKKLEPSLRSMFGTARFGDRDPRDRRDRDLRGQNGSDNTEKSTLDSLGGKAENAYKRRDANDTGISRDKELRRCAQSLLNKICPENIETIARRIKAEAKVESIQELEIVIELIFKKTLAEPHYCETYASMVSMLKGEMPSFPNPNGGKDMTFKSILLNVCQNEFEKMPRTVEASPDEDEMELKDRIENMKGRFLANMKFIGHLFLQKLLGCSVISGIVSDLIGCNTGDGDLIPEEHVVECVCELLTAIGFSLEAMPIGKDCVTQVCGKLMDLKHMKKIDGKGALSKRIQFAIQDVVDMRKAGWMKKTFKAVAKTKEQVRAQQEKEAKDMKNGKCAIGAEVHVAGARPTHLKSAK